MVCAPLVEKGESPRSSKIVVGRETWNMPEETRKVNKIGGSTSRHREGVISRTLDHLFTSLSRERIRESDFEYTSSKYLSLRMQQ
jgi:hypothetical protein